MKTPFFSVVIPIYNRGHRISKGLESLKNQTFQDFETIIVDDASTDDSFKIVSAFPLKNKILLKNKENQERCISRNNGIQLAKGKFICFLDSDDYHLPQHLERLKDLIIENKEKRAFYFSYCMNESNEGIRSKRPCIDLSGYNLFSYLLKYTINPQRWAVHRDVMKENLFDPRINICEDLDVTLRMANKKVPFIQLKEETTIYVQADDSFNQSDPNKNIIEYDCYKKIFQRKELRKSLPLKDKNRLLSKCHYFFTLKANIEGQKNKVLTHAFKSFFLCPKGYNGKTNKNLFVLSMYNLPIIGFILKTIKKL